MKPITLSDPQLKVVGSRKHLILDMGGQRAGKTHLIGFVTGFFVTNFPLVNGFIGANTDQQLSKTTIRNVKQIWKTQFGYTEYDKVKNPNGQYVVDKIPPPHFIRYQEPKSYYNTISFMNGAFVFLGSLKNYLAHEGLEFGWAHLDEVADTKEEAVKDVILARLSQPGIYYDENDSLVYFDGKKFVDYTFKEYKGDIDALKPFNPCYFHTSPKSGITPWLIDMFKLSGHEEEIKSAITRNDGLDFYNKVEGNTEAVIYSTYHNKNNLQANYIKNRLDELTVLEALKYIFGYPFAKTGGEFLPSFDRLIHSDKLTYYPDKAIHLSFDFNALPYVTLLLFQVVLVKRWFDANTNKYYKSIPDGLTNLIEKDVVQVRLFDEICLPQPKNSTHHACERFIEKYGRFNPEIYYYGDASGKSNIPGMPGDGSNFKTIARLLSKFAHNSSDRVPLSNPRVMRSRDFFERILNDKYAIEFVVDKDNCPESMKDFEFVKEGDGGQLVEYVKDANGVRYEKNGHPMAATRYFLTRFFEAIYKKLI